jgi:hypothetical protein
MLGARCAAAVLALIVIPTSCASGPSCPPLSRPHSVPTLRALEERGGDIKPRPPPPPPDREQPDVCKVAPYAPQCALMAREPPAPRCLPTDPKCGPEFDPYLGAWGWPVWRGPHGESAEKCYRPTAQRYPSFRDDMDACSHDGECHIAGCDLCVSYRRFPELCSRNAMEVTVPPDATPAPPRWCGCVENRCTMFTQ